MLAFMIVLNLEGLCKAIVILSLYLQLQCFSCPILAFFGYKILGTPSSLFSPSDCPHRDNRQHVTEKRTGLKEEEDFRDVKRDSLKIKLVPKEEEQEVDIRMSEDKHHHVARELTSFTGTLKSVKINPAILFTILVKKVFKYI